MIDYGIADTDEIKDSGHKVLQLAKTQCLLRLKKNAQKYWYDKKGTFTYELEDFFLCAKEYVAGGIVSCHTELVDLAIKKQKRILMFIEKNNAFYEFDPIKCKEEGKINYRKDIKMTNFYISLGVNYEKKIAQEHKAKNTLGGYI